MNWEVRTMPSATLCSKGPNPWWNSTLFFKNLRRFWPIWGSYGAVLLLVPLTFLLTWLDRNSTLTADTVALDLVSFVSPTGLVFSAVWSVISAMAVFSYLYNARSVQLYQRPQRPALPCPAHPAGGAVPDELPVRPQLPGAAPGGGVCVHLRGGGGVWHPDAVAPAPVAHRPGVLRPVLLLLRRLLRPLCGPYRGSARVLRHPQLPGLRHVQSDQRTVPPVCLRLFQLARHVHPGPVALPLHHPVHGGGRPGGRGRRVLLHRPGRRSPLRPGRPGAGRPGPAGVPHPAPGDRR